MAKKRRGRPKKAEGEVRNLQIRVCVSPREYKAIRKAAEADDRSMSSLAREAVLLAIRFGA